MLYHHTLPGKGGHYDKLGILAGWGKKLFCIPLCAEVHEGVETLRKFQGNADPVVNGRSKLSVTTLMAPMAGEVVSVMSKKSIVVLGAYFAVGPVFSILREVVDDKGDGLIQRVLQFLAF